MPLAEHSSVHLSDTDKIGPPLVRRRDLGVYERLLYLCSLDHPKHFCVAADIEGELVVEDLPDAFAALQRRHPLLTAEIHSETSFSGKPGPAFYATDRPIDLIIRPLRDKRDWIGEAERQLASPFAAAHGPLMRSTLFYRPGKAQILLTFHHSIADGLSAAFVMRDLIAALGGQSIGTLAARPSSDALVVRHPDFRRGCDARPPQKFDPDALRAIGIETKHQTGQAAKPHVTATTFDKTFTRRLRDTARSQGTTVHGALSAAAAMSGEEQRPGIPFTIVSPFDLRQMLGVDDGSCGVYIGASRHVHAAASGDFWALARQATDEIALAKNIQAAARFTKALMINVPVTATSDIAVGMMATRHRDAMISNLGRLPLRQTFGRLRLSAFWGPIYHAQAPQSCFLGASTLGGRLRLVETTPAGTEPYLASIRDRLELALHRQD